MKRLLRLLFRAKGFAHGGQIPRPTRSNPDDLMLMLSEGRVWRVVDGKLVETDDLSLRKFNKLRER